MTTKKYSITAIDRARRRKHGLTTLIRTPKEARSRGGKTQGNLNAINGTGVCGRSKERRIADAQKAGLIGGPIAAQNPNSKAALRALLQDREHQRFASHCGNHVRRGIFKINCEFCAEA